MFICHLEFQPWRIYTLWKQTVNFLLFCFDQKYTYQSFYNKNLHCFACEHERDACNQSVMFQGKYYLNPCTGASWISFPDKVYVGDSNICPSSIVNFESVWFHIVRIMWDRILYGMFGIFFPFNHQTWNFNSNPWEWLTSWFHTNCGMTLQSTFESPVHLLWVDCDRDVISSRVR